MKMIINFYDVEHGSCTHIITPNGKHILVDIGSKTNSSISSYIKNKYFGNYDGNISALIITHPHVDHIYDLPQLLKVLSPLVLYRPRGAFDIIPTQHTEVNKEITDCANRINREYNNPIEPDENPLDSKNNGGVDIKIISPLDIWTTKDDLNTFSSVVIITYGNYKFVLTGDNPKSILQNMIEENYQDIKSKISNATVLLAPHHGRTHEYCDSFFRVVNPYLTVVSDKSIVHSTQEETAKLYKGRGAKLYETERYVLTTRNDGTISFTTTLNSCNVSMKSEGY